MPPCLLPTSSLAPENGGDLNIALKQPCFQNMIFLLLNSGLHVQDESFSFKSYGNFRKILLNIQGMSPNMKSPLTIGEGRGGQVVWEGKKRTTSSLYSPLATHVDRNAQNCQPWRFPLTLYCFRLKECMI